MAPEIQQVLPKYVQIADHIRDQILRGELRPGDEIPSERRIVERVADLSPDGDASARRAARRGARRGTPGLGHLRARAADAGARARDRYARGRATGQIYTAGERSRDHGTRARSTAPEPVALALGIAVGRAGDSPPAHHSRAAGPVEVSSSWFAEALAARAPRLAEARAHPRRNDRLHRARDGTARASRTRSDQRPACDRRGGRALELGDGPAAVLVVHHTAFDAAGEPIEFAEAVYPPDRWSFEDEYPIAG